MIGDVFLKFTHYSWFRRVFWRPIYETLARIFPVPEWRFMNYGYVPVADEAPIALQEQDEEERFPLQLYHYLALRAEIKDKDILEVGCGRGGGSYYLARYLAPRSVTGLDLASAAVAFANRNCQHPNLKYVQGNAEQLPFPDDSFDAVINVESSHAYGSFTTFLAEVKRVLRPGGNFVITDMRMATEMPAMITDLSECGLHIEEETDITAQVVAAIEQEDDRKNARIKKQIPWWLTKAFREFAGVKDSALHRHLRDRYRLYYRWKLVKAND